MKAVRHTFDGDAQRQLAVKALRFSLDVMFQLQDPAVKFLDSPRFEKLSKIKHLVQASVSDMEGAGLGLRARVNISASIVVALYQLHGIGMDNLSGPGEPIFIAGDADRAYFNSLANNSPYRV